MKRGLLFKILSVLFITCLLVQLCHTYKCSLDGSQNNLEDLRYPINEIFNTGFLSTPIYTLIFSLFFIVTVFSFTETLLNFNLLFFYCFRAPPQF